LLLIFFDLEDEVVGVDGSWHALMMVGAFSHGKRDVVIGLRNGDGDETLIVTGGGRAIVELFDLVGSWEVFVALVADFSLHLLALAPKGIIMIEALVVRRVRLVFPFVATGAGAL
jgi:hypothetical protein